MLSGGSMGQAVRPRPAPRLPVPAGAACKKGTACYNGIQTRPGLAAGLTEEGTQLTRDTDTEELRRELLDEVYAGAFSGLGAMFTEEQEICEAGPEELEEIARRHGMRGTGRETGR